MESSLRSRVNESLRNSGWARKSSFSLLSKKSRVDSPKVSRPELACSCYGTICAPLPIQLAEKSLSGCLCTCCNSFHFVHTFALFLKSFESFEEGFTRAQQGNLSRSHEMATLFQRLQKQNARQVFLARHQGPAVAREVEGRGASATSQ